MPRIATRRIRFWFRAIGSALSLLASGAPAVAAPVTPTVTKVPGKANLLIGNYDLASLGYTQNEYFVSGEATAYVAAKPLAEDGRWSVTPSDRAGYRTRLVVIRPSDPSKFNGVVMVEWLNVSGGLDAPAEWLMAHRELVRRGYAYVGVSAQKVGIEGGASLGADMSLKKMAPERYGSLVHPGDAFAYDIFTQAGRLVRRGGDQGVLGPLVATRVLAAGESQSAHFLTTYVNAVDPLAKVYDGYLIHSRFSGSAPLDGSSIIGRVDRTMPAVVKFRPDLRVPVLVLITETDLIGGARAGYYTARQLETSKLRVWEVGGIRSPWIDVPTALTSGASNGTSVMASLFGSGEPFEKAKLDRLYPGGQTDYLGRFTVALDTAIVAGHIVPEDREEIRDLAAASYARAN